MKRNTRLELEIGGSVRPLLFDFEFLNFLTEEIPFNKLDEYAMTKPWVFIPALAFAALKSGAEFEGKKEKVDIKQVSRWVSDMDDLEANKIVEAYKTAMGFIGTVMSGSPLNESPVIAPQNQ